MFGVVKIMWSMKKEDMILKLGLELVKMMIFRVILCNPRPRPGGPLDFHDF